MEKDYYVNLITENSSESYKSFNEKISNSSTKIIGCKLPSIRKIAKEHKDDFENIVKLPVHEYFEIDMLKGIVISDLKKPFAVKQKYLDEFVKTIENWAVCDSSTVKVPKNERKEYYEYFIGLALSHETFVCRYGITGLMDNFLDDEHIDGIFATLCKVNYGSYYVDMAVAWLVATAMSKQRDKTVAFLNSDGKKYLNVFTYNKALQKMRDSYRISQQDKEWTKTMKR